eukprot:461573-Hanusia_phi.AAC.3
MAPVQIVQTEASNAPPALDVLQCPWPNPRQVKVGVVNTGSAVSDSILRELCFQMGNTRKGFSAEACPTVVPFATKEALLARNGKTYNPLTDLNFGIVVDDTKDQFLLVYQELALQNASTGDTDEGNAADIGLLWLQSLVSRVLMEQKGGRITNEDNTEVGNFRNKIGQEKEKGIKEALSLKGMSPISFWITWLLSESIIVLGSVLVSVCGLYAGRILVHTNFDGELLTTGWTSDLSPYASESLIFLFVDSILYFGLSVLIDMMSNNPEMMFWKRLPSNTVHVDSNEHQSGLEMRDVHKTFRVWEKNQYGFSVRKEVLAVNGLNLKVEDNTIFCLLGHNGAGKTTSMSIMTGGLLPDSGWATIAGQDVVRDKAKIRKSLGVCPQFDVLYSELSCWEHMLLYGGMQACLVARIQMKGMTSV